MKKENEELKAKIKALEEKEREGAVAMKLLEDIHEVMNQQQENDPEE